MMVTGGNMRRLLLGALCVLLGAACSTGHVLSIGSPPAAVEKRDYKLPAVLDNVWKVVVTKGSGSGWPIDSRTLVTARHVVHGDPVLYVLSPTGEFRSVVRVIESETLDVAFLEVDFDMPSLPLAATILNPGDPVRAFGFPHGSHPAVSQGIVFGWAEFHVMVIDCGVLPGMSGGPVANEAGEVVSMAVSCTIPPGRSMTLTIPVDSIVAEWEMLRHARLAKG